MRILFATTVPATLRAFLLPLADACRARGWSVEALAAGAATDARLRGHFDRLLDVPWSRRPTSWGNVRAVAECGRVLRDGGYDLVHVHTPVAAFVTRLAAMRTGFRGKVVYTAHGFHFVEGGSPAANLLYLSLEKLVAARTDLLIVINREDREAAIRHRLVPADRLVLVDGVGVDTDRFSRARISEGARVALRERLQLGEGPVVTMVAEFIPRKRHADLLRAAPLVLSEHPSATFVLAGAGPLLESTRGLAGELGLDERVRFLGQWDEMPLLLAVTDIVVLPSLREGLPVSLMEAMSMEVPFVGTDVRGIRELAAHGSGLLVPPRSPDHLAEAILRLLRDRGLALALGRAGRRCVLRRYGDRRIISRQIQIYEGMLSRSYE